MVEWLIPLKGKQKNDYSNLSSDDDELDEDVAGADIPQDEENDGYSSGDGQPPDAKRARTRMSRMSVDAQITEVGRDMLFDLDIGRGRGLRSISRSSRASSVASIASSAVSRT
jgi:hypothetical protein